MSEGSHFLHLACQRGQRAPLLPVSYVTGCSYSRFSAAPNAKVFKRTNKCCEALTSRLPQFRIQGSQAMYKRVRAALLRNWRFSVGAPCSTSVIILFKFSTSRESESRFRDARSKLTANHTLLQCTFQ